MTNPYESPQVPPEPAATEPRSPISERRENVWTSVFLILVGAFFFVVSGSLLLMGDFEDLQAINRREGGAVAYMFFYCVAGGLTSVFHICYLLCGRPAQHWAGIWASGLALVLTGLVFVALSLVG